MAAWTLNAQDVSGSNTIYLEISFAGGTTGTDGAEIQVQNGTTVEATVKLLADPAALANKEADGLFVSYTGSTDQPSHDHYWPFTVITPARAEDAGISSSREFGAGRPVHRPRSRLVQNRIP